MAIQTKYKVFLESSFLDQNLQPIFNSDEAGVWNTVEELDATLTASGSAGIEYEIISYKHIVE